uniref:Cytochrome P450 CYP3026C1 n=1 Tax=Tigriopus kingsejongensis TaxID=1133412 RepID=A0A2H4G1R9_9MAXI|nr:cytochrome P450 CYP3026C1 [Tigriopus kingsejongensis]
MWIELLILCVALFGLFYWYMTKDYNLWKNLGVPQDEPSFPWGSLMGEMVKQKRPMLEVLREQYQRFPDAPAYGGYVFHKPVLILRDPELVKTVLIRDFNTFVDRTGIDLQAQSKHASKLDQIWSHQLTMLQGEKWKAVRSTLSPIFTSGKMKVMFEFLNFVTTEFVDAIRAKVESQEAFELKDLCGRLTMDGISSCAFGVHAGSFKEDETMFVKQAKALFSNSFRSNFVMLIALFSGMTRVLGFFDISLNKPEPTRFFYNIVKSAIEARKKSGETRNDLVDLMIKCMKADAVLDEDPSEEGLEQFEKDAQLNFKGPKKQFDEVTVVANAMVMLLAGYDTTSNTLAWLFYEVTRNPDIQERLFQETERFEEPTYSDFTDMPYLECVVNEALRMYPQATAISRGANQDYVLPGVNIPIKKGNDIYVNLAGIHFDPKYYPNPETFNPDNFSAEAKASRHPYAFLTFGHGPRACIGMRFALLEMKMAVFHVIKNFELLPCAETPLNPEIDPKGGFVSSKHPLLIKATSRQ